MPWRAAAISLLLASLLLLDVCHSHVPASLSGSVREEEESENHLSKQSEETDWLDVRTYVRVLLLRRYRDCDRHINLVRFLSPAGPAVHVLRRAY